MLTVVRNSLLLLLTILITSCDEPTGSGNIFDDPPDCYYDSLFGCGTFDIPFGSSYRSAPVLPRVFSARRKTALTASSFPDYSGNWSGTLNRQSSSCNFETPAKVTGQFSVQQIKNRVTVTSPLSKYRALRLRGTASKSGLQASTFGALSFCSYSARASLASNGSRNGTLSISGKIRCPFQRSCDVSYNGNVTR